MQEQILKQNSKEESAVEIVPPKQAVKELLTELKTLKNRKEELLFPIQDELTELEEKAKRIQDEITILMQDVKETVFTDDAKAVWKQMPKPREYYDVKALDAVTDESIREVLDGCKKITKQGSPKVNIEVY